MTNSQKLALMRPVGVCRWCRHSVHDVQRRMVWQAGRRRGYFRCQRTGRRLILGGTMRGTRKRSAPWLRRQDGACSAVRLHADRQQIFGLKARLNTPSGPAYDARACVRRRTRRSVPNPGQSTKLQQNPSTPRTCRTVGSAINMGQDAIGALGQVDYELPWPRTFRTRTVPALLEHHKKRGACP